MIQHNLLIFPFNHLYFIFYILFFLFVLCSNESIKKFLSNFMPTNIIESSITTYYYLFIFLGLVVIPIDLFAVFYSGYYFDISHFFHLIPIFTVLWGINNIFKKIYSTYNNKKKLFLIYSSLLFLPLIIITLILEIFFSGDNFFKVSRYCKKINNLSECKYDNGKYIGETKFFSRYGKGTYIWDTGDKYVGEWKDNKQNGNGILIKADGKETSAIWMDGKIHNSESRNQKIKKAFDKIKEENK